MGEYDYDFCHFVFFKLSVYTMMLGGCTIAYWTFILGSKTRSEYYKEKAEVFSSLKNKVYNDFIDCCVWRTRLSNAKEFYADFLKRSENLEVPAITYYGKHYDNFESLMRLFVILIILYIIFMSIILFWPAGLKSKLLSMQMKLSFYQAKNGNSEAFQTFEAKLENILKKPFTDFARDEDFEDLLADLNTFFNATKELTNYEFLEDVFKINKACIESVLENKARNK